MRVRSTSNMQWTWALVRRDSIMRCAMILRTWFMGTRSPGIDAGAPSDFAGDRGGRFCGSRFFFCWRGRGWLGSDALAVRRNRAYYRVDLDGRAFGNLNV